MLFDSECRKVIHVDHDLVARHVARFNHDKSYNPLLEHDDGIKHVFYHSFDEVKEKLDDILDKYGRKSMVAFCVKVIGKVLKVSLVMLFSFVSLQQLTLSLAAPLAKTSPPLTGTAKAQGAKGANAFPSLAILFMT